MAFKPLLFIGLMLFALFFGAGNLIFPPALGQAAGTHLWPAISGFLLTGVGLPLLGVLAIGLSGKEDVQALANRVHPWFGLWFPIVMYLTIGPLFAIPRTATTAYEIGIIPFLPGAYNGSQTTLLLYTVVYFAIACWLAYRPGKIVDRIGKGLTPILLVTIGLLIVANLVQPMGQAGEPSGTYQDQPFFTGFQKGYLTMDSIASLVFGIIVIQAIKQHGVTLKRPLAAACLKAGLVASIAIGVIYVGLAMLGTTSTQVTGVTDNGGTILSIASAFHYGVFGTLILGVAITLACLTTCVGLISSCASFFHKLRPSISYGTWAILFSVVSMIIANAGLTNLIAFSVPVLVTIYPLVMVLIALTFVHLLWPLHPLIYKLSLLLTFMVSVLDGLAEAGIRPAFLTRWMETILPFQQLGMGWLLPAAAGALLGVLLSLFLPKSVSRQAK